MQQGVCVIDCVQLVVSCRVASTYAKGTRVACASAHMMEMRNGRKIAVSFLITPWPHKWFWWKRSVRELE
jgi:hypothetical protein